ncbi:hypothetical protein F8M49_20770 [Rhodococcus zopfii]|uniref:Uncharacterized protein n=1 Tax=Rhodococcus zopfii TaxID=43772 RepID=A0ABU3WT44_9NOCA|nr:hypothetical protein [Rhodococcus zopfii]
MNASGMLTPAARARNSENLSKFVFSAVSPVSPVSAGVVSDFGAVLLRAVVFRVVTMYLPVSLVIPGSVVREGVCPRRAGMDAARADD